MKDPHMSPCINALEGAKPGVYWANVAYFDGMFSVCMACINHHTLPLAGTLNWVGGGTAQALLLSGRGPSVYL